MRFLVLAVFVGIVGSVLADDCQWDDPETILVDACCNAANFSPCGCFEGDLGFWSIDPGGQDDCVCEVALSGDTTGNTNGVVSLNTDGHLVEASPTGITGWQAWDYPACWAYHEVTITATCVFKTCIIARENKLCETGCPD